MWFFAIRSTLPFYGTGDKQKPKRQCCDQSTPTANMPYGAPRSPPRHSRRICFCRDARPSTGLTSTISTADTPCMMKNQVYAVLHHGLYKNALSSQRNLLLCAGRSEQRRQCDKHDRTTVTATTPNQQSRRQSTTLPYGPFNAKKITSRVTRRSTAPILRRIAPTPATPSRNCCQ